MSLYGATDAVLKSPLAVWEIKPHRAQEIPLFVEADPATFTRGQRRVYLHVFDDRAFARIVPITLLGPMGAAAHAPAGGSR